MVDTAGRSETEPDVAVSDTQDVFFVVSMCQQTDWKLKFNVFF